MRLAGAPRAGRASLVSVAPRRADEFGASRVSSRKASVLLCLAPVLVRRSNQRHPALGGPRAGRYACGVCELCVARWSRELSRRAVREFDATPPGQGVAMVTLTFSDEAIASAWPDFGRSAWRRFAKAFSAAYLAEEPGAGPVKWLALPELGELRGRLHLHAVAFGVRGSQLAGVTAIDGGRVFQRTAFGELVRKCWPHGFVKSEPVQSRGGVGYVVKYAAKGRASVAAALAEHRRRARLARDLGAPVPSFVHSFWVAWPRGAGGGLAGPFADAVGQAQPVLARELGELVPLEGCGRDRLTGERVRRPVVLTRYETRRARRVAGLDDEASKRKRAARNPEPVEMAARELEAGGFDALRASAAHVDRDEVERATRRLRTARSLGRV